MALLLQHTFVFNCLAHGFWPLIWVLLTTKALKEEAWALKKAFSMFVVKLYSFSLSIAYIARRRHLYVESLPIKRIFHGTKTPSYCTKSTDDFSLK